MRGDHSRGGTWRPPVRHHRQSPEVPRASRVRPRSSSGRSLHCAPAASTTSRRWCGYRSADVRRVCGASVGIVENARFASTNSLYSLWLARDLLAEGFVVLNCDVLFHQQLLADLLTARYEDALLVGARGVARVFRRRDEGTYPRRPGGRDRQVNRPRRGRRREHRHREVRAGRGRDARRRDEPAGRRRRPSATGSLRPSARSAAGDRSTPSRVAGFRGSRSTSPRTTGARAAMCCRQSTQWTALGPIRARARATSRPLHPGELVTMYERFYQPARAAVLAQPRPRLPLSEPRPSRSARLPALRHRRACGLRRDHRRDRMRQDHAAADRAPRPRPADVGVASGEHDARRARAHRSRHARFRARARVRAGASRTCCAIWRGIWSISGWPVGWRCWSSTKRRT